MKKPMKTDYLIVEGAAYEPPRMTVIPLRASGSLLLGSMQGSANEAQWQFIHEATESETGNTATEWGDATASEWGENFF